MLKEKILNQSQLTSVDMSRAFSAFIFLSSQVNLHFGYMLVMLFMLLNGYMVTLDICLSCCYALNGYMPVKG